MFGFLQSVNADKFIKPQWIITPLSADRHLMVLSGVVVIDFWSQQANWHNDTVVIRPDRDFDSMIALLGVPPPPADYVNAFQAEQYAAFGGMSSIFDKDYANNAGFAVDAFAPAFYTSNARAISGIQLDIAVRDSDAALLRVAYHLTAVGHFTQVNVQRF